MVRLWLLHLAGLMICLGMGPGAVAADVQGRFAACVDGLMAAAISDGISRQTVADILGRVRQRPTVIRLDRSQPEFTQSFANYLATRVSADRVREGRRRLRQQRPLLSRVQASDGVPAAYLIALWGMETNYGSFMGDTPVAESLTTLSCDDRRSDLFSNQLSALLQLVDDGVVRPEQLLGSWAGAMGQVQFMPSVYLRHAVDADGDGRRDLWNSEADALASASGFLRSLGWVSGLRWGREVLVPDGFDYALAHDGQRRPLSFWVAQGLRGAQRQPLPAADVSGRLLVPMGEHGPTFLVYQNFDVIRSWNRSDAFAVAVGHLADRINGAGRLTVPAADSQRVTVAAIRTMQEQLNSLGFAAGTADGVVGSRTRAALSAFQGSRKLVADGHPDGEAIAAVATAATAPTAPTKTGPGLR